MAKFRIKALLHHLLTHSRILLGPRHKVLIGFHYDFVERELADVNLMLEVPIEHGNLLIMNRHTLSGMKLHVFKELWPKSSDIFSPHCSNQRLLLQDWVVGVDVRKFEI